MTVYLVGAGPGDPGLLTVRGARLLAMADAVVHDRLVDARVLALAPAVAVVHDVGKRPGASDAQAAVNQLLVALGRAHAVVVRLKGGDPFVFGRGGEELAALRRAGVDVEVVPGVSAAFAAPALAGVPVTHRGLADGVAVVTAVGRGGEPIDLAARADPRLTLVVLMGAAARDRVARDLIRGGLSPETPVVAIESASTPAERVVRTDLAGLPGEAITAPATLVVGAVAGVDAVAL